MREELRALQARVAALERRHAARKGSKRGYTDIPQSECDRRWNLWVEYQELQVLATCRTIYSRRRGDLLPTSRAWFCAHVLDEEGHRFSPREFERWFSRHATFAVGSRQDVRIRRIIEREIDRLRAAGFHVGMLPQEIDRLHGHMM
jgi:hypothetical protein